MRPPPALIYPPSVWDILGRAKRSRRMIRTGTAAGALLLTAAALASAEAAPTPLHWQAGQTLTYRVEQATLASDTTGDGKVESRTRLNLLKRWQVLSVDAAGVATLQLSLASLRLETTTPGGDKLVFDSIEPEKGTPELRSSSRPSSASRWRCCEWMARAA